MGFLRDVVSAKSESHSSSKRLVLVMAGFSLSVSVIILTIAAAFFGVDVEMVMWAVTTPLSGMAGASYVFRKDTISMEREHPADKRGE